MLLNQQPVINGEGKQTRDYVYVDDVVQANILALNHQESGPYNVGIGIEIDVNTIFRILSKYLGNFEEKHAPAKKGEQMRSVIATGKIEEKMGWKMTTILEDGLKKTVEWFKENKGY
jgi:UDP-glucose 4-epimerase